MGQRCGGKILKPYSSLFQAILAPNKMQLFVCLASQDHFASKEPPGVLDLRWTERGVFLLATELEPPV